MPSWTPGSATERGGRLRRSAERRGYDGRRTPDGVLLPASPQDPNARAEPALEAARRTRPWWLDVWVQIVRRKPLGTIGGAIVVLMLAGAVLADVIAP